MARRVNRLHPRQAKIPFEVGCTKRRKETSAGAIDVNGDVKAGVLLKLVQRVMHGLHGLVLTGEGDTQGGNHPDGVFIDALKHFFGAHDETIALEGNLTQLDVEVPCKFVPANLYGTAD